MNKKESIGVLGGGTWGATLAMVLSKGGHDVALWEYNPKSAEQLNIKRSLATLPELVLPSSVFVSHKMEEVLKDKNIILAVTPSHTIRGTFESAKSKGLLKPGLLVISAAKGIEQETNKTMCEIIAEIFPDAGSVVALSGPSHAEEVSLGKPVVLVSASQSLEAATRIQKLFSSETIRVYTSDDPVGVELGGAIKNVYAVACGVVDGLGLGDNTKAALMSRGLLEMTRIGTKMGAKSTTFFGLSGLGDLIVTCQSKHSRNRALGEKIGKGKNLTEALSEMTMVAEGVKTTKSAFDLAKKLNVQAPIIEEMFYVLFQNKSPRESIKDLMTRQVGAEMEGVQL